MRWSDYGGDLEEGDKYFQGSRATIQDTRDHTNSFPGESRDPEIIKRLVIFWTPTCVGEKKDRKTGAMADASRLATLAPQHEGGGVEIINFHIVFPAQAGIQS